MKLQRNKLQMIIWITAFSIAMGYLESAVVVYLREILYPGGFSFPLAPINNRIALTEIFREAATIVMLLGAGIIAGHTKAEKFAYFIYCFAIWDISYYVFLKLILNWPDSLLTWDILFLLPITWTGPVLAPVTTSLSMIVLALAIFYFSSRDLKMRFGKWSLSLLICGALLEFLAYIWDYSRFILEHFNLKEIWSLPGKEALYSFSVKYIPVSFNWILFVAGELLILLGAGVFCSDQLKPVNNMDQNVI